MAHICVFVISFGNLYWVPKLIFKLILNVGKSKGLMYVPLLSVMNPNAVDIFH